LVDLDVRRHQLGVGKGDHPVVISGRGDLLRRLGVRLPHLGKPVPEPPQPLSVFIRRPASRSAQSVLKPRVVVDRREQAGRELGFMVRYPVATEQTRRSGIGGLFGPAGRPPFARGAHERHDRPGASDQHHVDATGLISVQASASRSKGPPVPLVSVRTVSAGHAPSASATSAPGSGIGQERQSTIRTDSVRSSSRRAPSRAPASRAARTINSSGDISGSPERRLCCPVPTSIGA
jgi:hypothetical protein